MHSGTTFWAIQIDTWSLQQKTPKPEFTPLRRKLQAELKTALNNKTDYPNEQAAAEVFSKLPPELKTLSHIVETTPIYGII
jgi:hypothetical protein